MSYILPKKHIRVTGIPFRYVIYFIVSYSTKICRRRTIFVFVDFFQLLFILLPFPWVTFLFHSLLENCKV